jgi:hypothetical protein
VAPIAIELVQPTSAVTAGEGGTKKCAALVAFPFG